MALLLLHFTIYIYRRRSCAVGGGEDFGFQISKIDDKIQKRRPFETRRPSFTKIIFCVHSPDFETQKREKNITQRGRRREASSYVRYSLPLEDTLVAASLRFLNDHDGG